MKSLKKEGGEKKIMLKYLKRERCSKSVSHLNGVFLFQVVFVDGHFVSLFFSASDSHTFLCLLVISIQ